MAPFMTVAEAAGAYGVPIAALLAEFTQVIAGEVAWGPFLPPLPHGPVEQSSEG